jgi:hypothetical protein
MSLLRSLAASVGAGLLLTGAAVVGGGSNAAAQLDDNGPGCAASATFETGTKSGGSFTIDPAVAGNPVYEIPRKDTVSWVGSVELPPGTYSGLVSVDLPPPIGRVTIDSWSGDSQTTGNEGAHSYDLPSLVPAGVTFRVRGAHTDDNGTCSGFVDLKIEGGPFDSPVAPIGLAGTAVTGAALLALLKPLFKRVR